MEYINEIAIAVIRGTRF